ncbi:MAG TPA: NAD(P)/FAD-dependent oxidoreductase [Armatimonadota bacterium]|jgi:pyruvate/2-oxoglutarate dehydrogenase complex dihydrolipoamide dehydrogenase (E3) component
MSRQRHDYDVVVIGGGPAGVEASLRSAGYGLRTLLIERSPMSGRRNIGGAPSSAALIHAATIARTIATGSDISSGRPVQADASASAFDYVRKVQNQVRESDDTEKQLQHAGVEVSIGNARFVAEDTIQLDGVSISAQDFILCTGSSPALPDVPGLEEAGYRTTSSIFELERAPDSLAIIGAGQVGVELAQAFARLGTRVILLEEGDRILEHDDIELTSWLVETLRGEGVDIRLDACLEAVQPGEKCHTLLTRGFGGPSEACCETILLAGGRVPNVDGLNLGAAGVEVSARCVKTDARLHTTGPHVWACGDVRGSLQYAHLAVQQARRVARNIFLPMDAGPEADTTSWATFTTPQLAHLGLTEEEARDMGLEIDVLREPFSRNAGAIATDQTTGLIKVIADGRRGRILGVHILGANAGEMIHEWALAMRQGLSVRAIADLPHVYPTLSITSQNVARRWLEARAGRPATRKALATYRNARANREPIIYTLAAVGAAAGLLWAAKALSDNDEE